jgi:hypothetical protein
VNAKKRIHSQENVTNRLHKALALDHALTLVLITAASQILLEHGSRCLLDLQEQRITGVTTFKQQDHASVTDAAYANDLQGDIN